MITARTGIEDIEEEQKTSPSEQNDLSLYEKSLHDMLAKTSEDLNQIIKLSPAKAEIEEGLQILRDCQLEIKETIVIIVQAGVDAPIVAVALHKLKNANAAFYTVPNCMAVGKAGPDALKVVDAIVSLNEIGVFLDAYSTHITKPIVKALLSLDTAEFIKLSSKMISAINNIVMLYNKAEVIAALDSLTAIKTLRLTEKMIDAVCQTKVNPVKLSNIFFYHETMQGPKEIAQAILFLNENQMLDKIDIIALAGKNALKFAKVLFALQQTDLTLSKNLIDKTLIAVNKSYALDDIVYAFQEGERIDTLYKLFLFQEECKEGSLKIWFPLSIHQLISSYFHSSLTHASFENDRYAFIRTGQNAEKFGKSLGSLYKNKKMNDKTRYALEQCQEEEHIQVLHDIIASSSINAELFTNRPDLFLKLIAIVEQQYEFDVITMLLKHVPYTVLVKEDVRTAIADGLKLLSVEGNLNGILNRVNQQVVALAREHAREIAQALILLNKKGLLNAKNRTILLNHVNDAINMANQIIQKAALTNKTDLGCLQVKKRTRRMQGLMFDSHKARKCDHLEAPSNHSKRASR